MKAIGATQKKEKKCFSPCATRRQFLLGSSAATAAVLLTGVSGLAAKRVKASVGKYPRQKLVSIKKLKQDKPIIFKYPKRNVINMLIKLGVPAGGGVGPGRDIVAFNLSCTHMGGPLAGQYKPQYKTIGPCPFHLSNFDLTRHGILSSGHATQNLPQIELELDGNNIYATGVFGLIYGNSSNV